MKTGTKVKISVGLAVVFVAYKSSQKFRELLSVPRDALLTAGEGIGIGVPDASQMSAAVSVARLPYDLANAIGASASGNSEFSLKDWLTGIVAKKEEVLNSGEARDLLTIENSNSEGIAI